MDLVVVPMVTLFYTSELEKVYVMLLHDTMGTKDKLVGVLHNCFKGWDSVLYMPL